MAVFLSLLKDEQQHSLHLMHCHLSRVHFAPPLSPKLQTLTNAHAHQQTTTQHTHALPFQQFVCRLTDPEGREPRHIVSHCYRVSLLSFPFTKNELEEVGLCFSKLLSSFLCNFGSCCSLSPDGKSGQWLPCSSSATLSEISILMGGLPSLRPKAVRGLHFPPFNHIWVDKVRSVFISISVAFQVAKEIKQLYTIAFPLIVTGLLTYGKSAMSIAFMGRLGKDALAGGSLAISFANITGYSVLSGLAMGMDAISSQACGAKRWLLVGQTLQRTIVILSLFCVPISLLWLNVKPILLFFGQDAGICSVAATYLAYCLPDLIFQCFINPLKIYLRTQNITLPLMVAAAVALLLHGPINYLLVYHFGLGVRGVAAAAAFTDFNILLSMLIYLRVTGIHKQSWRGWSLECFKEWSAILRLAIPNCISVCLEWWWYELMIVLSGLLSTTATDAVAAMGILIQATSLIYIFPSSLSLAVSTRVGYELGAGQPAKAKISSLVALSCAVSTSFIALLFTVAMRNLWGRAFTADEAIVALTAAAMPVIGLCELGNCPQTTLCGVLRGSARPKLGANINLGSFYGVGLPVSLLLCFVTDEGLLGLWMGLLLAQLSCAVLMSLELIRTDWAQEAERAEELIGGGGGGGGVDGDGGYVTEDANLNEPLVIKASY
ncbi:hypothetical protein Nepgr_016619 [Nepenthes gracilis]|uniref:Protein DETOXIFICATION n=1 Tax=Nepenthes gracilis TaxID=150966 RepID=A0AAD3SN15_NEPGR|nr:hypothetical protein Nepgr_016619 [Nepenthes gracilis]